MTVDSPVESTTAFDTSDNLDAFSKDFFNPNAQKEEKPTETPQEEQEAPDEEVVEAEVEETNDADEVDSEESGEPEEETPEDTKAKKKSAQDRIKELTKARYDAEREAAVRIAELEGRLAELSKGKEPEAPAAAPNEGAPDPQAVDKDGNAVYPLGEYDPNYIKDLAVFSVRQEREAAKRFDDEERQKRAVDEARQTARNGWLEKLNGEMEETPDIVDKIASLDDVTANIPQQYSQYLVDVIMSLENGPKVMAYLADNKDTARSIVNSGAAAATVALGRLDARVAKVAAPPKTPTAAPKPPTNAPRGTSGQFRTRPDTDDLDAFTKEFFGKK